MNKKFKKFLVICGYILLFAAAIGAFALFTYLLTLFTNALYIFLLAKTSSKTLAILGPSFILLAIFNICCARAMQKINSLFTDDLNKKQYFLIACELAFTCALLCVILDLSECLFTMFFNPLFESLHAFFLAKTSSEALAAFGTLAVLLATCVLCYGLHKLCSIFTEKITSSYQSFKNENSSDNIFSEVYNDPTIGLKDKVLFFAIYLIYCTQLPFLYCASKISELTRMLSSNGTLGARIGLVLINAILLIPVALLELIKYPLVKLFSPLGLNVKQLSFLFNVSDVGTSNQSVHTGSFEHSILQCAQDLKQKFGAQSNILNKKFEDYISGSSELTENQKEQLKLYLYPFRGVV